MLSINLESGADSLMEMTTFWLLYYSKFIIYLELVVKPKAIYSKDKYSTT